MHEEKAWFLHKAVVIIGSLLVVAWISFTAISAGATSFEESFSNIGNWNVESHQNGKSVNVKKFDIGLKPGIFEGKKGAYLVYNFSTTGEDAVMISRKVSISEGSDLILSMYGNKPEHKLFIVFEDAGGERHFLSLVPTASCQGWKSFNVSFEKLLRSPKYPAIEAAHFGGDKNQKIDYPIKRLSLGISDKEDAFIGKGKIFLINLKINK